MALLSHACNGNSIDLDNEMVTILHRLCGHQSNELGRYLGRPYRLPETTNVPSFSK
jgi:hypothetical protein